MKIQISPTETIRKVNYLIFPDGLKIEVYSVDNHYQKDHHLRIFDRTTGKVVSEDIISNDKVKDTA